MKNAPKLTAERLRELLHYDPETGVFTRKTASNRWPVGHTAGSFDSTIGYVRIWIEGRGYLAHRLAWLHVHGEWPAEQIDHRNRDGSDNRIDNLRQASNAQNCQNRSVRCNNPHGVSGIHFNKRLGKWTASASIQGRQTHLGVFESKEAAAECRRKAELEHYPFLTSQQQHA